MERPVFYVTDFGLPQIAYGNYFSRINSMLKKSGIAAFFACLFLKYWLFVKERIGPGTG